ncbi:MAG: hypothetical protein GX303_07585 [Clostridiales bacterium]|nr:hypothetical protein [Clostridiales bacterium]
MTQQRVSVRLPGEIARALDKYCDDNYLDRSTVMRTALLHWGPLKKYLKEAKNMLDIDKIEAILEIQNLSIDFESFESGDELADYLDGREFPCFDDPMEVSEYQREALREIYQERS